MKVLWLMLGLGTGLTLNAVADSPASPTPAASPAADTAWAQIGTDAGRLTKAQQTRDLPGLRAAVTQTRTDAAGFAQQFPTDPRAAEAKLMRAQADQMAFALDMPDAPAKAAVVQEFHALATDPAVPMNVRANASMVDAGQVFAGVMETAKDNPHDPALWDSLETRIEAFEKTTGDAPGQEPPAAAVMLRHNQIMLLSQVGETDRLHALLAKLAQSPDLQMSAMAKEAQTKLDAAADLKTKPLDLKFTALDGSAVDLSKLRGKVVLLDFWATWCPPCRAETPNVVAAFQKYHAQGLEVVGISLDQNKAALTAYIEANHMPWPQYFDGKGWSSDIGQRFGIDSIPAMWLIGKNGVVATQEARDDLDGQIGKLLAAP